MDHRRQVEPFDVGRDLLDGGLLETSFQKYIECGVQELLMALLLLVAGRPPRARARERQVCVNLRYEFAGPVLERFIGPVFDHIAATFIDAFVKRADDLYKARS